MKLSNTGELKPYLEMKDSDVEWLGKVPTHWEVLPNRTLFEEVKERDHPEEPMLSVTIKQGIIRQKNLLEDNSKKDGSNLDKSAYKLVQPGDIAYNKMRAWQGAVGVSDYQGIVSPAYVVERPRKGVSSHYFHYLLRTPTFAKEAERWSYGITSDMWSLRPEHFKMIYACLPPPTEQTAIVRFLDHADRRIRRYIRAKQKLIALLEEQKQVIIHQAVTGQIDVRTGQPYPSYKDSGVEWLDKVPAHWAIERAKWLFQKMERPVREEDEIVTCFRDGIVTLRKNRRELGFTESLKEIGYQGIRRGDLVIHSMDAFAGAIGIADSDGKGTPVYSICKPKLQVNAYFYAHILREMARNQWIQALAKGIRERSSDFRYTDFASQPVPLPPFSEQAAVVSYLDKTSFKAETAISRDRRQMELLQEHRTRLIADVVTGKLDVREAAAELPEVDSIEAEDTLGDTFDTDTELDSAELDATLEEANA